MSLSNEKMYLPRNFIGLIFVCCLIQTKIAVAHELRDGFVEKVFEAKIQDHKGCIKMHIGLTEPTMRSLVRRDTESEMSSVEEKIIREVFQLELFSIAQQGVSVEFGEQKLNILTRRVSPDLKHHFSFTVDLEFDLPPDSQGDLKIIDETFKKVDLAVRYSLKSSGSSMLIRSNVAPIIVRAMRIDLSNQDNDVREKTCQIIATVATGPDPGKILD
ncbi:MAG: hypothetical protein AAGA30_05495 [Planctomycetota bacterium]